jgi:tetratricopeptide (TPR) repeat protein
MLSEEFLAELDARWNPGDPAGSAAELRELRAQRKLPLEQHVLDVQIARCLGLQGDFAGADRALDAVEQAVRQPPPVLRVRLLLERGRVQNSQDRPLAARPLFEQAHALAEQAGLDALDVDAMHMVAITYLGDVSQSLPWDLGAAQLAERSPDPRARQWLAALYNNMGYTYDDQGDHARALELFEQALRLRLEAGKPGPIRLARYAVAHAERQLGRIDSARARLLPLLGELEASGAPAGDVLQELGECELAAGRPDAARPYFAKAHAALAKDEWVRSHEPERLARLAQLGGVPTPGAP